MKTPISPTSGDSTPLSPSLETPATSSTDDSSLNSVDQITRKILLRKRNIKGQDPSSASTNSEFDDSAHALRESEKPASAHFTLIGHKQQSTWSKYLEALLLFSTTLVALYQHEDLLIENKQFLSQYVGVVGLLTALTWKRLQFPNFIYEFLFPPLLSLATYPEHFKFNLLVSLGAFPFSFPIKKVFSVLMDPGHSSVLDHVLLLEQVTSVLVTTSLSSTEIFLFSSLLLNLVYNANSVPALYLKTFLFGSLLALCGVWFWVDKIMKLSMPLRPHTRRPANAEQRKLRYALYVLIGFAIGVVGIAAPRLSFELNHLNPDSASINSIEFLLQFLFTSNPAVHFGLIVYWAVCLACAITYIQSYSLGWSVDVRRKAWHATIVMMFLPAGILIDPDFTKIAMAIALTGFFLVEFIRVTTIPPYGKAIHLYILRYMDERDTCGPIVVSHIFLMLGISIPIFLASSPAGIICLGMGDAMASIVGKRLGRHNWPGSKKTVEGSLAFVGAVMLGLSIYKYLQSYYTQWNFPIHEHFLSMGVETFGTIPYNPFPTLSLFKMLTIGAATSLLEAVGGMNDNVIVPVFLLILLQLS